VIQLQRDLDNLTSLAERDIRRALQGVTQPDVAKGKLKLLLPKVIVRYGPAAAAAAADWYDEERAALRPRQRFHALTAPLPAQLGTDQLVVWGLGPVYAAVPDWDAALHLLVGGTQKRIVSPARETVQQSAIEDPAARGWRRVVAPGECDFCQMLAGRGGVYTEKSARFETHDHCRCVPAPDWV
jgi:hypothetical protein